MVQRTAEVYQDVIGEHTTTRTLPGIRVFLALVLLLLAFVSVYQQRAPQPVAASAPATEFSSARALDHVKVVARLPHPVGSLEQASVRDYLLEQITAMGQTPEVQQTTVVKKFWRSPYHAAQVQNVLTRIKGKGEGNAVLLMAHYDSAPGSFGASDNGAAVASLLETIRALKADRTLRNDLIFLFSDAEEVGLIGAQGFSDEHPWAKDVKVVLNFEARGTTGPTVMFETSNNNGWLVKEFANAAPHPAANSLMYDIYRRLPNDSDLTVFKNSGVAALNFAFIGNPSFYHTQLDNFGNVDERSVQHQGSYALALARHFGDISLDHTQSQNQVYFDFFGSTLIHYSYTLITPATILIVLLFAGALVLGFKRGHITPAGTAAGFGIFLGAMVVAALTIRVVWSSIRELHYGYRLMTLGDAYNSGFYQVAFVALAIAVTAALYALCSSRVRVQHLAVGALLWWMLFLVFATVFLRGGSYLFTWPLLFTLPGLYIWFASPPREIIPAKTLTILAAGAIPAVILFAPLVKILFDALTLRMSSAAVIPLVWLLGLLVPQLSVKSAPRKWVVPGFALLISIGFIVAGSFTAGFSSERRQPNSVMYGLNADVGQAFWTSLDEQPDEWTTQFFGPSGEKGSLKEIFPLTMDKAYLKKSAPASSLVAPELKVLEDKTSDGVRTVRVLLKSQRQAPIMAIYEESNADILSVLVNGRQVPNSRIVAAQGRRRVFGLQYFALPAEGVELSFELRSEEPVKFRLVDQSYGLPDLQANPVKVRPDYMMPALSAYGDATFVTKTVSL